MKDLIINFKKATEGVNVEWKNLLAGNFSKRSLFEQIVTINLDEILNRVNNQYTPPIYTTIHDYWGTDTATTFNQWTMNTGTGTYYTVM